MELENSRRVMGGQSPLGPIDPRKARFPCCIVWAPLPVISWFIPFIGHVGICREDGVILDFAGPNFVCVDHFTFGAATRYLQVDQEKCVLLPSSPDDAGHKEHHRLVLNEAASDLTWDEALKKGTQEFQHRGYNLFTCNCHSFVANNLNRVSFCGHSRWNVVTVCLLMLAKGTFVDKASTIKTMLPFLLVMVTGIYFGGALFVACVLGFTAALVGWFLLGTYCFKNMIEL